MISSIHKIMLIVLVGGFPALISMDLTPCCADMTSSVDRSCCCHFQDLETLESENSLPSGDHDTCTCICNLGFFAIQGSSVMNAPGVTGFPLDLFKWDKRAPVQVLLPGEHASGYCCAGRLLRVQLSSLLC